MKVALVVHCFFPTHFYGTEAYTLTLAKGLVRRGHDVTVVSATFVGEPEQSEPLEERVHDGIRVVSIDKNAWPHADVRETWDQPAMRPVLGRVLDRIEPDLVHVCHLINHTRALFDVLAERGIPTVATLTDFFGICYNNRLEAADGSVCRGPSADRSNCLACYLKAAGARPEADAMTRLASGRFARPIAKALAIGARLSGGRMTVAGFRTGDIVDRADRLREAWAVCRGAIAPTQMLKSAYEANGFPAAIRLSRFGIDIDRAIKPRGPEGRIRLAYVGQLAPHKGVHVLIDALAQVASPALELTIWGSTAQDPAYASDLAERAEGLAVTFAGTFAVERMAEVMAEIDCLVIPSTWPENSPLVLLQALATHTPVIVSDVEGLTELVRPGENGLTFPRGDVDGLARVLRVLVNRPETAAMLSAGTHYARTPDDMVDEVVALYDEVMADTGAVGSGRADG